MKVKFLEDHLLGKEGEEKDLPRNKAEALALRRVVQIMPPEIKGENAVDIVLDELPKEDAAPSPAAKTKAKSAPKPAVIEEGGVVVDDGQDGSEV